MFTIEDQNKCKKYIVELERGIKEAAIEKIDKLKNDFQECLKRKKNLTYQTITESKKLFMGATLLYELSPMCTRNVHKRAAELRAAELREAELREAGSDTVWSVGDFLWERLPRLKY